MLKEGDHPIVNVTSVEQGQIKLETLKTTSDKWRRVVNIYLIVSLVKMGAKTPEELTDGEIFYDLDRFPKVNMMPERSKRGSAQGYMTMVSSKLELPTLIICDAKLWNIKIVNNNKCRR